MILTRRSTSCYSLLAIVCLWLTLPTIAVAQSDADPTIVNAELGFGGAYKLGCWVPLEVELVGGSKPWTGRLVVSVPDTDGVPTRVVSDANRPVGIDPGQSTTVRMFVRVGQSMSALSVQFVADDGKIHARRRFNAAPENGQGMVTGGVPSTNRLLLEFGPSLGLGDLVKSEQYANEQLLNRVVRAEHADDLPTRWYGYESIETVLLTTSDPELYRPLLQGRARIDALAEWVERGGRLVMFCASGAEELLSPDGALADLAPGKFEKLEQLTQSQPLATFSGSEQPITRDRRVNLQVPNLSNVHGKILASAGRSDTTVPLVVRSRRGLGEIVFVGLDFDRPPLNAWEGRNSFLRRVLDWQDDEEQWSTADVSSVDDLTGHLRTSLDSKFVGVQVVPFGLVAFLVGIYILLIGPGDYLFVKRVLRRTELTWLTFPLIVIGISVLAYVVANRMKGDQVRVNQVEIIDVDCTTTDENANAPQGNFACGTVWTHFFTPQVSELDLHLQPSYLGQTELADNQQLVSWLGMPGYGLGGMQASGAQTSVFDTGYQYGDSLSSMQRLPVQVWSTKTLAGRWSARVNAQVESELRQTGEGMVEGEFTNATTVELEDCQLLYGRWAYDLGRLPAGKSIVINDSLQPRTTKTLLTSATAGDDPVTKTTDDGTVPFRDVQWDLARLAKTMMFYRTVSGPTYTGMSHRYQAFVDRSALLEQEDIAILLAKCSVPGSQWLAGEQPLASNQDRRWTYYRFIVPVGNAETAP